MKDLRTTILATLLSLSVFGLATMSTDWIADKCPFDTNKARLGIYIALFVVTLALLKDKL